MAKKPSSQSKRSKKPVEQSAARGGGIMSLNKSNTTPFMKGVIILVIVAMVTLFLYGGVAAIIDLFKPAPKAAPVDPIVAIQREYDPQIQSMNAMLASDPTSYTLLVSVGRKQYDYAAALSQLISKGTTSAALPATEQWAAAAETFKKAVKENKEAESGVYVDYSVASFYSDDTTGAVKTALGVIKRDPKFSPAYFNLGIFYEAMGQNQMAIDAYQSYLALDPDGKAGGDPDFAKQQLQSLGAPEKATTATPLPGSTTTTP